MLQVRILPHDMEQGLKEFASGVEQLVDRLVSMPILYEGYTCHKELFAGKRQSTLHAEFTSDTPTPPL